MSARHDMLTGGSRENGFTLIELIIASAILLMVSAAAMGVVSSASTSVTKSKVIDRQRAAATAVLRRAMADTSWIARNSCAVGPCSIPAYDPIVANSIPDEPDGTVTHTITFTAVGIDLATDQVGTADTDGIVPDAYRLTVVDAIAAPGVFDTPPSSYTANAMLDRSGRGNRGTIEIRACAITPQVDDRIGTGLCESSATATYPIVAPGLCQAGTFECSAYLAAKAANPALYTTVTTSGMSGVQFNLIGPKPDSSASQTVTTGSNGRVVVRDLAPGRYELAPVLSSIPGGFDIWLAHSTPAGGSVTVGGGEKRTAVQVFRPVRTTPVTLRVETIDKSVPGAPVVKAGGIEGMSVKLLPIPGNRDVPERGGSAQGWTKLSAGVGTVNLDAATPGLVSPGLYSSKLLVYPGDRTIQLDSTSAAYVWIPPGSAATAPTELLLRQEICDPVVRRAAIVAACPAGYRYCIIGSVYFGECGDPGVAPTGDGVGTGGA